MKPKFLLFFLFTTINTIMNAQSPALVGYWHNWQMTSAPYIPLDQVDSRYNVICVSFGVPQAGTNSLIVFTPDQVTQATLITQIQTLHSQGKKVVISIGGATAPVLMSNATERDAFINSVTSIVNTYGFDGIDIDFEGSSLSVSGGTIANPIDQPIINLIAGIKQIMANYRISNNRKMFLSMAPETAFVQGGMSAYGGVWGAYLPVINALRDSMDILQVQLYNSGAMYGINGGSYGQGTADFIVSQTEAVIRGFNTSGGAFVGLPASKIAVGLPACTSAAGGGYTIPTTVKAAINYLRGTGAKPGAYTLAQAGGYPDLRGMMTWSINWDKVSTCGAAYEFAQNFQSIFNGGVSNNPPSVSITSPTNNASFVAPANVTINANATDSDGTISKVEFYKGTTLLNTDNIAPYSFIWSNVAVGTYSLTAKAYDNLGLVKTSTAVTIVVKANTAPSVSITSPLTNVSYTAPANVTINANATDTDGTISKVEFYKGTTLLNTDNIAPYSFIWSNIAVGTYSLTAKAYDNLGLVKTSTAVTIVVKANIAPSVSITSPLTNVSYTAPANVTINANATDTDGTISKVEFYKGTTLLNTDNIAPYSFIWSNVAVGTYSLTAKAYDNLGLVKTSTAVTIVVKANIAPSVSITSPLTNVSYTAPANVTINANATDTDGTISKVEFYNGTTLLNTDNIAPYSFIWSNIAVGTYSLTAKAYDNLGLVKTSTAVTIVVKAANIAPSVSITSPLTNVSYTAPASVTINANATDTDGTISKVEFYNGTTLLNTDNIAPYSFIWSNVAVGTYSLTAKAYDNLGLVKTSTAVTIVVKAANIAPSVSITSPLTNVSYTAPANVTINANATDTDGTISKVEFYKGTTLLNTDNIAPYSFAWSNVPVGIYALTAKATDNSGTVTTSSVVQIVVNTGPLTEDLIGLTCASANSVIVYELSAANSANITTADWWCNSSVLSIVPVSGQPWKATVSFGQSFTGGNLCVGANYSASPWYKQICKSISLCPTINSASTISKLSFVSPTPTSNSFNFIAGQNSQSAKVYDQMGTEIINLGAVQNNQSINFGEQLPSGIYFLTIQYEDKSNEVIKLIKVK